MTTTKRELKVVEKDGSLIAPLPEGRLQRCNWPLNEVGSLEMAIDPYADGASAIQLSKTEVQLWLNNELAWWGVPRRKTGNSRELLFTCDELLSYFWFRFVIDENLEYVGMEQLQIAQNLIVYGQSAAQGTNPDLNIDVAAWSPSGVSRDKILTSDRKHNLIEELLDFPTLDDGFDWSIEIFGDGRREYTMYFPQKGSLRNDLAIEYGRQITDYQYEERSDKLATKVDATGGTFIADSVLEPFAPREKNRYVHEDVAASTEYGVHVTVLPSGAKSTPEWLESRAKGAVAARKHPVVVPQVTCHPNQDETMNAPVQLLGNLDRGDWLPVRVDHGAVQVSGVQRVKDIEYDGEADQMRLTFTSVIPE